VCACPCVFAYNILTDKGLLGAKLATLVSICIAGGVYLVMLLLLRGLSEEDIKMLPKSQKIIKILRKAKLLGD
jgi:stage V sporulation protein B